MKKVRFQFNYTQDESSFEKISGISETIPNQVLPVSEILIRFSRGTLDRNIAKPVYYDGIEEFITDATLRPDFDITDAYEMREQLNTIIAQKEQMMKEESTQQAQEQTAINESEGV